MARVRVTTSHGRRVVARYNAVDSPDNCSIKVKKIKKVHMVDKYKVPKSRNYITEWPFVPWPFFRVAFRPVAFCRWPFVPWPYVRVAFSPDPGSQRDGRRAIRPDKPNETHGFAVKWPSDHVVIYTYVTESMITMRSPFRGYNVLSL